ncbi:MAG TPA: universal stress protein [Reyranella sp.]|nr:universal stress protein [Reyranella sp.]
MPFQKILIAVDSDPIALHAAEVGVRLATALQAQIALVHSLDPSMVYAPEGGLSADEFDQIAQRDGKRLIADIRARLPEGTRAFDFVLRGNAPDEIVKAAKDWGADIIVIGSHGRRGVTRAVMGSVAEAVLRRSSCPVFVVPALA